MTTLTLEEVMRELENAQIELEQARIELEQARIEEIRAETALTKEKADAFEKERISTAIIQAAREKDDARRQAAAAAKDARRQAAAAAKAQEAQDAANARAAQAEINRQWCKEQEETNPDYKTALCKNFIKTGKCPFDDLCLFAHGKHELRKSKTVCWHFVNGSCHYGDKCKFTHPEKCIRSESGIANCSERDCDIRSEVNCANDTY